MARLRKLYPRYAPNSGVRVEHFYSGALTIVNDETETDNQDWVEQLLQRGYRYIDGTEPENVNQLGVVRVESAVEPLGTQVVDTDTDVPSHVEGEDAANQEPVLFVPETPADQEGGPEEEASDDNAEVQDEETAVEQPVEETPADDEPSELERLMRDALAAPADVSKPKRRSRKKTTE